MPGHHTLPTLAALVLSSCDGSSITPSAPPPLSTSSPRMAKDTAVDAVDIDISGAWHFHEDATSVLYDYSGEHSGSKAFRCSTDGTYTFICGGGGVFETYRARWSATRDALGTPPRDTLTRSIRPS